MENLAQQLIRSSNGIKHICCYVCVLMKHNYYYILRLCNAIYISVIASALSKVHKHILELKALLGLFFLLPELLPVRI